VTLFGIKNSRILGFLTLFAAVFLVGCFGSIKDTTLQPPLPKEEMIYLRGHLNLSEVFFPPVYEIKDMSDLANFEVFLLIDEKPKATIATDGNFLFEESIKPREQLTVRAQHKKYKGLIFETLLFNLYGNFQGALNTEITLERTARTFIANILKNKYGKRKEPADIADKYIIDTVTAIQEAVRNNPDFLLENPIWQDPEVEAAALEGAKKLKEEGQGTYTCDELIIWYIAGDNPRAYELQNAFKELRNLPLQPRRQVSVFIDALSLEGSHMPASGTKFIGDEKGFKEIFHFGEINSASEQTFSEFIKYSLNRFPAERLTLVISAESEPFKKPPDRYIRFFSLTDGTERRASNILTVSNAIREALTVAEGNLRKADLIVWDSPYMATLEVLYEMSDLSLYTMAFQSAQPGPVPIADYIAKSKAKDLAETRAGAFFSAWKTKYPSSDFSYTLSLVKNSACNELVTAFKNYCSELWRHPELFSKVKNIRNIKTETVPGDDGSFDSQGDLLHSFGTTKDYVDVKHFLDAGKEALPAMKIHAKDLLDKRKSFVLLNEPAGTYKFLNATGLSFIFPDEETWKADYASFSPAVDYFNSKLLQQTLWDEVLRAMYNSSGQ